MSQEAQPSEPAVDGAVSERTPTCGIIMPIAGSGAYEPAHWAKVLDLIRRAIVKADMQPLPVWEGGNADIIHQRIVFNLYQHDVAVCDVSGLNPNVMFELGMRLTYGKPTILVSDDETQLPFDTRMIHHTIYPRALDFHRIETFITSLTDRLREVWEAKGKGEYKPFVTSLGEFKVVEPLSQQSSLESVLLQRLDALETAVGRISQASMPVVLSHGGFGPTRRPPRSGGVKGRAVMTSEIDATGQRLYTAHFLVPISAKDGDFDGVLKIPGVIDVGLGMTNGTRSVDVALDPHLSEPDMDRAVSTAQQLIGDVFNNA